MSDSIVCAFKANVKVKNKNVSLKIFIVFLIDSLLEVNSSANLPLHNEAFLYYFADML